MGLILWRTETLVANTLGLSCIILRRLSKCLHNCQHCQIRRDSSSSNPKVSEQSRMMSGKVYSQSIKTPTANSSVATTLDTPSASHRDGSSKSMVKHTASEIAMASDLSAGPSTKERRAKYPSESKEFYRTEKACMIDAKAAKKPKSKKPSALKPEPTATPHTPPRKGPDAGTRTPKGSALPPSVKSKPSTHGTAPPPRGIMLQVEAQKQNAARTSGRTTRHPIAATNASSSETSTTRSNYQQHLEELEKHRVILYSLKCEYGRAKADYERSENTLRCLRRQDQHPLWFWHKQKTSAERSLGKTARKLQKTRILEREMVVKIDKDENVLLSKDEKLANWRRKGKDRWKELSVVSA